MDSSTQHATEAPSLEQLDRGIRRMVGDILASPVASHRSDTSNQAARRRRDIAEGASRGVEALAILRELARDEVKNPDALHRIERLSRQVETREAQILAYRSVTTEIADDLESAGTEGSVRLAARIRSAIDAAHDLRVPTASVVQGEG